MKMTKLTRILSVFLCVVLIAAMALFTTGCNDKKTNDSEVVTTLAQDSDAEITTLGEGEKSFRFSVVGVDSKERKFIIKTDKTTVGEALLDVELIAGEQGNYGLYVKTVDGTTLDYEKDGKYWAFYVNDSYASGGVDTTEIDESATYSFKAE